MVDFITNAWFFVCGGMSFLAVQWAFDKAGIFYHMAKMECKHDWNEWGDPVEEKQYRICQKCKMVERRYV